MGMGHRVRRINLVLPGRGGMEMGKTSVLPSSIGEARVSDGSGEEQCVMIIVLFLTSTFDSLELKWRGVWGVV